MEAAIEGAPTDAGTNNFTGSVEGARQFLHLAAIDLDRKVATLRAHLRADKERLSAFAASAIQPLELPPLSWTQFRLIKEQSDGGRVFDAIQSLYRSTNRPRDRQIAERITELHRVVLTEGEHILPASLEQFVKFFLNHPHLGFPRITMTPDGTLRARWIRNPDNFVAIEFTGTPLVRMVAELPRDGQTAAYFASEPVKSVVATSRAIGASFE